MSLLNSVYLLVIPIALIIFLRSKHNFPFKRNISIRILTALLTTAAMLGSQPF